jgi:hypothetical protein
METSPIQYIIPDLLATFPWPRLLSDYYLQVKSDSGAWVDSYPLFNEELLRPLRHNDSGDLSVYLFPSACPNYSLALLAAHTTPRDKGEYKRNGGLTVDLF